MEGLFTIPLGLSFRNYHLFDKQDHAFEVIKTSGDYDALIPAWYLEKHKARGTTTSHFYISLIVHQNVMDMGRSILNIP